ncbi:hypothetical protein H9Q78_12870 [Qiania dongpingensis]|uniref:Uncharacterized protein n=2 Tax=Qiania dongpingensis TaxID=2763669 RepID=A0A7G9G8E1_9FIRM|nr:hypothetical protein H9Q78_12870 [Qiania dongpingensis]
MKAYQSEEDIIQNLKDAGCDEDTIRTFLEDLQRGKRMTGIQLLEKHRCCLVDHLHQDQKQIDCLDYLLFMMRKEQEI